MLAFTLVLAAGFSRAQAPDRERIDPARIEDLYRHSVQVAEETSRDLPASTKAIFDVGRVHQRFGQDEEAAKVYRRGLSLDQRRADIWSRLGFLLSQRNDMEAALSAYREALRQDPAIDNAHFRIGLIRLHQGQREEAIEEFRAEIANRTPDSLTYAIFGHALREQGQSGPALQCYREALRLNPDERGAHYGLAQLYQDLGRKEDEAKALEEFKRLKETEDAATKEALAVGGNRPRLLEQTAETYYDAAGSYLEASRFEDAERCARLALKFDPGHAPARELLLSFLRRSNRLEEAIAVCRASLAARRSAQVLYDLAGLCVEKESPAEAASTLEETIRAHPELGDAHRELARLMLRGKARGSPQRALELARQAVALAPRDAMAYDILGWAHLVAGEGERAIEAVRTAVRLDPQNPGYRRRLSQMEQRRGLPPR